MENDLRIGALVIALNIAAAVSVDTDHIAYPIRLERTVLDDTQIPWCVERDYTPMTYDTLQPEVSYTLSGF